jgi:hypothetical protein
MVDRLLTCVPELRPCLERRWRKTAQCSGVPDREKCIVFSSITAADIPADHELRGTRMLRALLDFGPDRQASSRFPDRWLRQPI